MLSNDLLIYTIYRHPRDFPDKFVVRVFCVGTGAPEPVPVYEPHAVVGTLEEARLSIPYGLVSICRSDGDHLSVVESWL